MNSAAEWKLDAHRASLTLGSLTAVVDLAAPLRGLHDVCFAARPLAECEVLGVELEPAAPDKSPPLVDAYQRRGDLVATYAQTPSAKASTQVYWRAASFDFLGAICPTIDLQISVQTNLLDSRPARRTRSRLPAGDVARVSEPAAASAAIAATVQEFLREPAAHCFVFSPSGWHSAYIEMVHPADAEDFQMREPNTSHIEIAHRLFEHNLEKGVILRARVRGLFAPRSDDRGFASAAWRQFIDQPPPLTT